MRLIRLRAAALADPLTARYGVGGTASAGVDYSSLGTSISFPANVTSVSRMVTPLADTLPEGAEMVIVTLLQSAAYAVGNPGRATVTLSSDD
jgi:hypothetical protein